MIRKILILVIGLFFLNACVGVGFDKGLNYKETSRYRLEHVKESHWLSIISSNGNVLNVMYNGNECGGYYLFGPLVPFIPIWENKDCSRNISIGISNPKDVYIKFNNKIYKPLDVRSSTYIFPISIELLKDEAVLVVESEGEIFQIPLLYQSTFQFFLWPGR